MKGKAFFRCVPFGAHFLYADNVNVLTKKYKSATANAYVIIQGGSFTLTPNVASLLGTESFTFKLVKWDNANTKWVDYESSYTTSSQVNFTQTGAFTSTFTVTEDKRFVSYKITAPDVIYDTTDEDYAGYVTVKGVLNNGQTVDLHADTDFKVIKGENLIEDAASPSNVQPGAGIATLVENNLLVPGSGVDKAITAGTYGDKTSVTGKYKVVINYTGETTEKTVTICKDAPTTKTIKFNSTQTGINIPQSESSNGAKDGFNSVDAGKVDQADGANAIELMMAELEAKDSYGVVAGSNAGGIDAAGLITLEDGVTTEQIKITVTDIDSINGTVANNGTENITFTNFVAGDSFTVTFTAGTASFTTVVSIQ